MNPELKDPINAAGAALAIIGGVLMFCVLVLDHVPPWVTITGFILWGIGVLILAIHSRNKR